MKILKRFFIMNGLLVFLAACSDKQFSAVEFSTKQAKNFIRSLKGLEFHKYVNNLKKPMYYFINIP